MSHSIMASVPYITKHTRSKQYWEARILHNYDIYIYIYNLQVTEYKSLTGIIRKRLNLFIYYAKHM